MKRGTGQRRLIVAIDGPAGAGKSTTARLLAQRLGYRHIDTGALYRALAWKVKESRVAPGDEKAVEALCRITHIRLVSDDAGSRLWVDGEEVTDCIRGPEISKLTSQLSALGCVRNHLLGLQRSLGEEKGIVMEGRDIGTVVFPNAEAKFFLDARPAERAARRYREMFERGEAADLARIAREVGERDRRDSNRAASPLIPAPDAVVIDSTDLPVEEVVVAMTAKIDEIRASLDSGSCKTPSPGISGHK